jgi:Flp pilus assembly pilin Flp
MKQLLGWFVRKTEGQDLIEYALLGGIIVTVTAALITAIATQTDTLMTALCNAINAANCN